MTTTTTTTAYNKELQLEIAEWRLCSIELYLDKSEDLGEEETIEICQGILYLADDEIVTEYLS